MTTRRPLGGVASAMALALALTACGSDGEKGEDGAGGAPASTAAGGRGPITFATGKDLTGQLQRLADTWNTSHADQKVRIVELPEAADQQRQQLVQNAQIKSDAYDVVNLDAVWTAEFAARRWVVELPASGLDTAGFVPSALRTGMYRGKLYAAPWLTGTGILYYRKDLLDRAGVEQPPKTWAELRAACDKVRKLPAGKGAGCYAGQHDKYEGLTVNYSEAVQSAGGTVFDDSGAPRVTTPQAKAGLEFLVDGFANGTIPKDGMSFKEEESRRRFQDGKLVFHRNWAYVYALASEDSSKVKGRFGVAPLPGADGLGSGTLGGNNLAVSAFSKRQATARDFVAFMTSLETEREYGKKQSFPLSRAALYDDPEMIKLYPYLPVMKEALRHARSRPVVVRYGDVTAAVQEQVYAAERGEKSVDQAAADLQNALAGLKD